MLVEGVRGFYKGTNIQPAEEFPRYLYYVHCQREDPEPAQSGQKPTPMHCFYSFFKSVGPQFG